MNTTPLLRLAPSTRVDRSDRLTPREIDVLDLMAAGRSNQGIAMRLFLSPRTVEALASSAFDKLGVTACATTNRRVSAVLAYLTLRGVNLSEGAPITPPLRALEA